MVVLIVPGVLACGDKGDKGTEEFSYGDDMQSSMETIKPEYESYESVEFEGQRNEGFLMSFLNWFRN
jgi:hypothetical protein